MSGDTQQSPKVGSNFEFLKITPKDFIQIAWLIICDTTTYIERLICEVLTFEDTTRVNRLRDRTTPLYPAFYGFSLFCKWTYIKNNLN